VRDVLCHMHCYFAKPSLENWRYMASKILELEGRAVMVYKVLHEQSQEASRAESVSNTPYANGFM